MELQGRKATKLEVEFGRKLCDAQDKILELKERIKELEGYKEGARDCLRNAKQRIKEFEAENEALRGQITEWKNKAIGLSYELDNLKAVKG